MKTQIKWKCRLPMGAKHKDCVNGFIMSTAARFMAQPSPTEVPQVTPHFLLISSCLSVIFIDFNYEGKPGEKSLRSLDQVAYQGESGPRARSSLKDSYGNPIEYDTLEAIDANKPSKNKQDPNSFVIPGYASGILQQHELPTRNAFGGGEGGRKIDDDRIHFIDPLQNNFQGNAKPPTLPAPGLSFPSGNEGNVNTSPIDIPKPNIDLPETPQTPINDPLDQELHPPPTVDGQFATPSDLPSVSLEVPHTQHNLPQQPIHQDLVPPQIPSDGQNVIIPRPNLDAAETPIDNSNGPLNQGLLPPQQNSFDSPGVKASPEDNNNNNNNYNSNPFLNPNSNPNPNVNEPVLITEVHFAPKPSNGLLPPKDPSPNDISYQQSDFVQTTSTPPGKFTGSFNPAPSAVPSFNQNQPGIGSQRPSDDGKFQGSFSPPNVGVHNQNQPGIGSQRPTNDGKYQGSFGGPPGILSSNDAGSAPQQSFQIPVQILQSPPSNKFGGPTNQQTFNSIQKPSGTAPGKFQGSFGGPPGVLSPPQGTFNAKPQQNFAGNQAAPTVQAPTTQILPQQRPTISSDSTQSKLSNSAYGKYTGKFGGPPGILSPYDNDKN